MIANIIAQIAGGVIGIFGQWGQAKQEVIKERVANMQRSGTDEVIVVTVFAPLWVAWFSPERADTWLKMVDGMPEWYVTMVFGIISAVFGLGENHATLVCTEE